MTAKAFGIATDRIEIISDRHIVALAGLHGGALHVLASDDDVTPDEMVAVVKCQLIAGLTAMLATEQEKFGRDPAAGVDEIVRVLKSRFAAKVADD